MRKNFLVNLRRCFFLSDNKDLIKADEREFALLCILHVLHILDVSMEKGQ